MVRIVFWLKCSLICCATSFMGPSIYDVHTEVVRLRCTHVDGGGVRSMWMSTQKIQIRVQCHHPVFFSGKSWRLFYQNFIFVRNKKGKFLAILINIINY